MVTESDVYAKRPGQRDRLGQATQKRQSIPTALSAGLASDGGVQMETTLSPSGAMVPAILLKRAEQAVGSDGKSSDRHAVSKNSEVSAASSPNMIASQLSDHGGALSPVSSTSMSANVLNLHRKTVNRRNPPNTFSFNWQFFLAFFVFAPFAGLLVGLAIHALAEPLHALTAFALSVMS